MALIVVTLILPLLVKKIKSWALCGIVDKMATPSSEATVLKAVVSHLIPPHGCLLNVSSPSSLRFLHYPLSITDDVATKIPLNLHTLGG